MSQLLHEVHAIVLYTWGYCNCCDYCATYPRWVPSTPSPTLHSQPYLWFRALPSIPSPTLDLSTFAVILPLLLNRTLLSDPYFNVWALTLHPSLIPSPLLSHTLSEPYLMALPWPNSLKTHDLPPSTLHFMNKSRIWKIYFLLLLRIHKAYWGGRKEMIT